MGKQTEKEKQAERDYTTIQFRFDGAKKARLNNLAKQRGLKNLNELMRVVCEDVLDNPNRKFILKERVI